MGQKVLFIVGPTGSGKTRLSIEVAKKLDTEIISADSRQIFKYLDIGTAKASKEELQSIPHHLFDTYDPKMPYSAGIFSRESRAITNQLFHAKKIPIVVGGSGLYVKAMMEGFSEGMTGDEQIREVLKKRIEVEGTERLFTELSKIDPKTAEKIHQNDKQRLVRAMEIFLKTGKPISEYKIKKVAPTNFSAVVVALDWDRDKLYQRIELRVDKMIRDGLIAEVAMLKQKGYDARLNSLQTVGYKEVFEYFNDEYSFKEMIVKIKKNSRNYAKRQLTWFRNDENAKWFKMHDTTNYSVLADEVIDYFEKSIVND